jgi:hypothetical protein
MMRASPSAKGLRQTRDVMNLNGTLAELTGNTGEYSEWCYWITIMGGPSATAPWGWQPDGRHAIINRFVPGDQAVMTPVFMGSEPVRAASGKFKGTVVLQAGQDKGLALMQALNASQQAAARMRKDKSGSDLLTDACNLPAAASAAPALSRRQASRQNGACHRSSEGVHR